MDQHECKKTQDPLSGSSGTHDRPGLKTTNDPTRLSSHRTLALSNTPTPRQARAEHLLDLLLDLHQQLPIALLARLQRQAHVEQDPRRQSPDARRQRRLGQKLAEDLKGSEGDLGLDWSKRRRACLEGQGGGSAIGVGVGTLLAFALALMGGGGRGGEGVAGLVGRGEERGEVGKGDFGGSGDEGAG
jgi:hypothetical protein